MVKQTPDKKTFFDLATIGFGWRANTAKGSGKKPDASGRGLAESKKYLAAMIENLPRNADEQAKLGEFISKKMN